ncbi:MAG: hypothetical protein RL701_1126, partial [Pseudomonadota bacterium]
MTNADPVTDERFEFEAYLGAGAIGAVYRVRDKARGLPVALKLLKRVDARSLFHFKSEFRTLANLSHPNLLQLYELVTRGDEWMLTMELVDGTDFLRYVRPSQPDPRLPTQPPTAASDHSFDDSTQPGDDALSVEPTQARNDQSVGAHAERLVPNAVRPQRKLGALDEVRLRASLRQMAEGLRALHAKHFLHRDLKPDNVLVFDETGRVVICDFGLVVEARRPLPRKPANDAEPSGTAFGRTATVGIAGTVAFMSPEQAAGQELTAATDWYAVGVMLYLALTLTLPIEPQATWEATMLAKQQQTPRDPREINPDAPADLSELALALLAPEPSQRAGYTQVAVSIQQTTARNSHPVRAHDLLLGRERELAQLEAAFAQARAGELAQVFV